jgi:hypothetical protein
MTERYAYSIYGMHPAGSAISTGVQQGSIVTDNPLSALEHLVKHAQFSLGVWSAVLCDQHDEAIAHYLCPEAAIGIKKGKQIEERKDGLYVNGKKQEAVLKFID